MDSTTELHFLKKINEFVYDEDKVVTFKWLSKTLDVNVEDSKKLLEIYTTNHKGGDLEIVYWISGKLNDNSYRTLLIKQAEFDDNFREFADVSCKFIYSIYKKNETDFKELLINSEVVGSVAGSLSSKRCIKRTLKQKAPLPALKKTDITKHKPSLFINVPAKSIKSASESNVKTVVSSTTAKKENGTAKGIANFISKMPPKQKAQSDICISKSNVKPDKSTSITEEDVKEINKLNDKIQTIIDTDDSEEEKRTPKNTNRKDEKPKNKRKRIASNSTAKNKKQRKRIVEPNDSDSDDIFANDDEEEHQEPMHISDEEDDLLLLYKPTSGLDSTNKKRKLVKQTFTDEDGYIMTCKKWVCVDDESEDEKKNTIKDDKKESKDNKAPEAKDTHHEVNFKKVKEENTGNGTSKAKGKSKKPVGNQTTLMKFFTKA
ncbi:DNA polymerase delta subunit 3-like [Agrilus planipennis]|uniref:DNA polymerase delta subunit 3 n=1 Tax=Agrilus planipennis TaxID=224129 RepID=A0A1W4XER5_AGRPL|nr:DNA polymerase delta subunit 3-like [Agrilus planipennis]